MNKKQILAMVASYLRSVLGAGVALYLSGVTDIGKLALSLLAALLPVAIRALNPNDLEFGLLPSTKDVDVALLKAKADSPEAKALQALFDQVAADTAKTVKKKTPPTKK
jgi:hypothetical protein